MSSEEILSAILKVLLEKKMLFDIVAFGVIFAFLTIVFPYFPARYLSKLKSSKSSAKGPFKGLSIKLQGPVAIYFILFLVLFSLTTTLGIYYFKSDPDRYKPKTTEYELWGVEGWVELQSHKDLSKIKCIIRPGTNFTETGSVGHFSLSGVPLPKKAGGTTPCKTLSVETTGYETISIDLDEKRCKKNDHGHESIKKVNFDKESKIIKINSSGEPLAPQKWE